MSTQKYSDARQITKQIALGSMLTSITNEALKILQKNLPLACKPFAAIALLHTCLLYTSDAADERSSVDLGGRRIIKKKNNKKKSRQPTYKKTKKKRKTRKTHNKKH